MNKLAIFFLVLTFLFAAMLLYLMWGQLAALFLCAPWYLWAGYVLSFILFTITVRREGDSQ